MDGRHCLGPLSPVPQVAPSTAAAGKQIHPRPVAGAPGGAWPSWIDLPCQLAQRGPSERCRTASPAIGRRGTSRVCGQYPTAAAWASIWRAWAGLPLAGGARRQEWRGLLKGLSAHAHDPAQPERTARWPAAGFGRGSNAIGAYRTFPAASCGAPRPSPATGSSASVRVRPRKPPTLRSPKT